MLREFRCDLHVHTCLSPCADLDLYPSAIVRRCIEQGLDLIAVCDHNASENVPHVLRASRGTALAVLPGMEVMSSEEVHCLAIFDILEKLSILQEIVYRHLPGKNDEAVFGCQVIVNERDEVEGFNDRLLIGATGLPLQRIVDEIHRLDGLAVPAHIDRQSFGVLGQLGFLPEGLSPDALEIGRHTGMRAARRRYPELARYAFVESSDAHRIDAIGTAVTRALLAAPTAAELKRAFGGKDGRRIVE